MKGMGMNLNYNMVFFFTPSMLCLTLKFIPLLYSLSVNQFPGAGTGTKRKFGEGPVEDPRVQLLAAAMQGTVNLSSRRVRLDFSPEADKLTLLPPLK